VYTTLTFTRPATSGTTRRFSGLVLVNRPFWGPGGGGGGGGGAGGVGRWLQLSRGPGGVEMHDVEDVWVGVGGSVTHQRLHPHSATLLLFPPVM
jgi:hypothetical protein